MLLERHNLKRVICCTAYGRLQALVPVVYQNHADYCKRIGCDYILFSPRRANHHIRKYDAVEQSLDHYDHICLIDVDLVISPETPDIFDQLGHYEFAACRSPLDRSIGRVRDLDDVLEGFDDRNHVNTGMVVGKSEVWKDIIREMRLLWDRDNGKHKQDQLYFGPALQLVGPRFFELDRQFNTFVTGDIPDEAFICHVCGDYPVEYKTELLLKILDAWREKHEPETARLCP
jgi:hypothetical protein